MLEEYEIQMEALQIKSFNNISQAIVKFVFRRRIEYHVTKTFLQVNILMLIIYMPWWSNLWFFADIYPSFYWILIILLWCGKLYWQGYGCIDNYVGYSDNHIINRSGIEFTFFRFINLSLKRFIILAFYRHYL